MLFYEFIWDIDDNWLFMEIILILPSFRELFLVYLLVGDIFKNWVSLHLFQHLSNVLEYEPIFVKRNFNFLSMKMDKAWYCYDKLKALLQYVSSLMLRKFYLEVLVINDYAMK